MKKRNISEFICDRINKLPKIKGVSASYCYDKDFEMHLVIISPSDDRFKYNELIEWEEEFWHSYFEKYSDIDMSIGTKEDFELYCLEERYNPNQKSIINDPPYIIESNYFHFGCEQSSLDYVEQGYALAA